MFSIAALLKTCGGLSEGSKPAQNNTRLFCCRKKKDSPKKHKNISKWKALKY